MSDNEESITHGDAWTAAERLEDASIHAASKAYLHTIHRYIEQQKELKVFATANDKLDDLLGITADMSSGDVNQDSAMYWLELVTEIKDALEKYDQLKSYCSALNDRCIEETQTIGELEAENKQLREDTKRFAWYFTVNRYRDEAGDNGSALLDEWRRAIDIAMDMSVDAERYRFLRDPDNFPGDERDGPSMWEQLTDLEGDYFDEFVDKLRHQKKENE